MTITIVVTRDRQPRSFRWCIRRGINQPHELGVSRAEDSAGKARRAAERVFGPLEWLGDWQVDERNSYVVDCAVVKILAIPAVSAQ